jgi:hypothetical protein
MSQVALAPRITRSAPVVGSRQAPAGTLASRLAKSGLFWGYLVSAAMVLWVWLGLNGREYYQTPLRIRAYTAGHQLLRPSGPAGQMFGVVGTVLLLVPFLYMARKRVKALKSTGTVKDWLEVHLFCGVVGPVLITLHTSFKFNGIISAAYWSMVMVMLSGFVGRYLYVRIPRSIRGNELTLAEVAAEASEMKAALAASGVRPLAIRRIEEFERRAVPSVEALSWVDLVVGELTMGWKLRGLARDLRGSGLTAEDCEEAIRLTADRATLLRRAAYLQRTKKLFEAWHIFHLPLVYLLLVIAAAHIGIVIYMGYVPFRW